MTEQYQVIKGDLFELAPKHTYLAHACNCQGVWGGGVAKEFKKRYPEAFEIYNQICTGLDTCDVIGTARVLNVDGIIAMFTSIGYGDRKDPPEVILANTEKALKDLAGKMPLGCHIASPKINSGLFGVPWDETEKLILRMLKVRQDMRWTVYEL